MPSTPAVENAMENARNESVNILQNGNDDLFVLPHPLAAGGTLTHFDAKGQSRSSKLDAEAGAKVSALIKSGKLDSAYDLLAQIFDGLRR